MKRIAIGFAVLLLVAVVGFAGRSIFGRDPIIQTSTNVHFCSCVEERPDLAPRFIDASEQINNSIEKVTASFIAQHGLRSSDFTATFCLLRNGNYTTTIWCSNRTCMVGALYRDYETVVRDCFEPHRRLHLEAHGEDSTPLPNGPPNKPWDATGDNLPR